MRSAHIRTRASSSLEPGIDRSGTLRGDPDADGFSRHAIRLVQSAHPVIQLAESIERPRRYVALHVSGFEYLDRFFVVALRLLEPFLILQYKREVDQRPCELFVRTRPNFSINLQRFPETLLRPRRTVQVG